MACVFNSTRHRTDHYGDAAAGIGDLNNRRGIDLRLVPRTATAATLTRVLSGFSLGQMYFIMFSVCSLQLTEARGHAA